MDCLIAAHSLQWRRHLSELFERHGYTTLRTAGGAEELAKALRVRVPELVLVMHEPETLDGVRGAAALVGYAVPAILAVTSLERALADQAAAAGYAAFLVVPSLSGALHGAVATALRSEARLRPLQEKVAELERKLAERKLIERAKGVLMETEQLTEEQAYKTMRSRAMARRIGMAALAGAIIAAAVRRQ